MQDRTITCTITTGEDHYVLCAVIDGHGRKGGDIAAYITNTLPAVLQRCMHSCAKVEEAIVQAFMCVNKGLLEVESIQGHSCDGGAAVALVLLSKSCYTIAHCGDCKAAMLRYPYYLAPLTADHVPDMPDESERVRKAGGLIICGRLVHRNGSLGMTRCIGDHHFAGVSAVPEVQTFQFNADACHFDVALLLATDGLWDVLCAEDITVVYSTSSSIDHMSIALCQKAKAVGQQEEKRCDDISVIIVRAPRL